MSAYQLASQASRPSCTVRDTASRAGWTSSARYRDRANAASTTTRAVIHAGTTAHAASFHEPASRGLVSDWLGGEEGKRATPGVGGVVGAVRGTLGRVDEAVLGLGVHHHLAVVARSEEHTSEL